jgi:hypothetical protein
LDRAHQPVRVWWAPWRQRCSCGARRWPCPDTLIEISPPPAYWLSLRNKRAHWVDGAPETPNGKESPDPPVAEPDPPDVAAPTDPQTPAQQRNRQTRQRRRWHW